MAVKTAKAAVKKSLLFFLCRWFLSCTLQKEDKGAGEEEKQQNDESTTYAIIIAGVYLFHLLSCCLVSSSSSSWLLGWVWVGGWLIALYVMLCRRLMEFRASLSHLQLNTGSSCLDGGSWIVKFPTSLPPSHGHHHRR